MVSEEVGHGEKDAGDDTGGEPVAFVGENLGAVGHVEVGEALVDFVGIGGGNDGVGGAVEDESGGEVGGGLGGVGFNEASRDVDEGAEACSLGGIGCGGELGGKSQGEESAQGDAGEDDLLGVNAGAGGGEADGFVGDAQPGSGVDAILDGGKVRVGGVCAVEVVRGVKGDVCLVKVGGKARRPEIEIPAGAVQEDDGWIGFTVRRGFGFLGEEADGNGVDFDSEMARHIA